MCRCERCGYFRTVKSKSNIEGNRETTRKIEATRVNLTNEEASGDTVYTPNTDMYGVNLIYIQQKSLLNNKLSNQFNVCNAYSGVLACVCVCDFNVYSINFKYDTQTPSHAHKKWAETPFMVYISIQALMLPKFIRFGIVISILIREQRAFLVRIFIRLILYHEISFIHLGVDR